MRKRPALRACLALAVLIAIAAPPALAGDADGATPEPIFPQYALHSGETARAAAMNLVGGIGSRLTSARETAFDIDAEFANASLGDDSYCAQEDVERFWIGGVSAWTRQDSRHGLDGYRYDARGIVLGQDWQRGDLTVGIAGAYAAGDAKSNPGNAITEVDTLNFGVYASYDVFDGLFVDGNLGYGKSWNDARAYPTGGGEKTASFSTSTIGGGANVGRNLDWCGIQLTPTAGVQWTHVGQSGWTEGVADSGAAADWFEESDGDFIEFPLAIRLSKAYQFANGTIVTPEARAAWIYNAGNSDAEVRTGAVGGSDGATLHGIDAGRYRGVLGGGVKANINTVLDAFVDYSLEFREGYRGNNFKGGVGISF